ncbi:Polysaccharide lyase family 1 protein [Ceratobasidium theobromae]|uniref:Polysaccharide lyase family 1 protein n=1 Tax=Ceratobasidium theobromae TaxID=1582974 RepID=A0A5N5QH37_9AGAM|nr:Polysaccharide lyase family 1 protein [Ceratobasidium theobromae]
MRFSVVSVSLLAALVPFVAAAPTCEHQANATEDASIGKPIVGASTPNVTEGAGTANVTMGAGAANVTVPVGAGNATEGNSDGPENDKTTEEDDDDSDDESDDGEGSENGAGEPTEGAGPNNSTEAPKGEEGPKAGTGDLTEGAGAANATEGAGAGNATEGAGAGNATPNNSTEEATKGEGSKTVDLTEGANAGNVTAPAEASNATASNSTEANSGAGNKAASTELASEAANIGYASQGGTTGGIGGATVTVSTLEELTSAVASDDAKIVIVSGAITGNTVIRVGSNTSILGKSGASLTGVGLRILGKTNVIVRNIKISKVLASAGDALAVQQSSKVWLDHLDLSSDRDHDKDYYDGLLDITRGSTQVTVSNSYLHDHFKASLVGHVDTNAEEDKVITVTYALNKWENINSRMPSVRAGTSHIYNNLFLNSNDGINTRVGAQILVENNVWEGVSKALYSTEGFAVSHNNNFGEGANTAPQGTFAKAPYDYDLLDVEKVKEAVASSGATLAF